MGLRHVDPDAAWTQYHEVMVAPVGFWASDDTTVSQADQLALTNYFTQALREALAKKFTVVDAAGPGVLEVQVGRRARRPERAMEGRGT